MKTGALDELKREVQVGDTVAYVVQHEFTGKLTVKTVTGFTEKSLSFGANKGSIRKTKKFVIVRD